MILNLSCSSLEQARDYRKTKFSPSRQPCIHYRALKFSREVNHLRQGLLSNNLPTEGKPSSLSNNSNIFSVNKIYCKAGCIYIKCNKVFISIPSHYGPPTISSGVKISRSTRLLYRPCDHVCAFSRFICFSKDDSSLQEKTIIH